MYSAPKALFYLPFNTNFALLRTQQLLTPQILVINFLLKSNIFSKYNLLL